jgi:hypothetical protein
VEITLRMVLREAMAVVIGTELSRDANEANRMTATTMPAPIHIQRRRVRPFCPLLLGGMYLDL